MAQEVVAAPIPGKIVRVALDSGGSVGEGEAICVMESMKMEIPILAPVSGVINEIRVSPGQAVKTGEVIAVIEY